MDTSKFGPTSDQPIEISPNPTYGINISCVMPHHFTASSVQSCVVNNPLEDKTNHSENIHNSPVQFPAKSNPDDSAPEYAVIEEVSRNYNSAANATRWNK